MNPDPGNHASFRPDAYTIGPPYYRTPAGEFKNSRSIYGTFDQGSNAWEWNDTVITSECRGYRGGSWGDSSSILAASYRGYGIPSGGGTSYLGFRVASVPEPCTLALLIIGMTGLMTCVWRPKKRRTYLVCV